MIDHTGIILTDGSIERQRLIIKAIKAERKYQDRKFGTEIPRELSHSDFLAILIEEVGEAAHEVNEWRIACRARDIAKAREHEHRMVGELVQAAACCVKWLEFYGWLDDITAAVDVQKDRLEVEIVGWGRGKEKYSKLAEDLEEIEG